MFKKAVAYVAKKAQKHRASDAKEQQITINILFIKIDLGAIKDKYEEMYGNELWQDISDECSSDYKRLLLNLIRE